MRETVEDVFEQYGQWVYRPADGAQWKACVQPVRRKNEEADMAVTELGDVDHRLWLYIGPGDMPLWKSAEILVEDEAFWVRERTQVRLGEMILYERALLEKAKEALL